ncbi:MAG TPA: Hsp20/alpha crystallin family protein [Solirubrobacteraceae bacterium]|nr:Hsp20/alpha crystallin family protein [Solirubrobacteraceae bacterium]
MLFDPFVPFNSLLPNASHAGFLPTADVTVGENDMVLTMDLPGMTADELDIQVADGELIVRGERKRPPLPEGSRWAFAERSFGAFERRLRLPKGVDPDQVSARMDNGVLSLVVPKPEALKPRTIAIGSGTEQRQLETSAA